MARLIDADNLFERKFKGVTDWTPTEATSWQRGWNDALETVAQFAPTVDPTKHGHWEYKPLWKGNEAKYCECSACHKPAWWETDYCPNCGAKMDEVET